MMMTPDDPWLANINRPASAVGFKFQMCQCNINLHVRVHGLAVHPAMVQLCNLGTHIKYSGGVGGTGYVCGTGKQSSTAPPPSRSVLLKLSVVHPSALASGTIPRDPGGPWDSTGPCAPGCLAALLLKKRL